MQTHENGVLQGRRATTQPVARAGDAKHSARRAAAAQRPMGRPHHSADGHATTAAALAVDAASHGYHLTERLQLLTSASQCTDGRSKGRGRPHDAAAVARNAAAVESTGAAASLRASRRIPCKCHAAARGPWRAVPKPHGLALAGPGTQGAFKSRVKRVASGTSPITWPH